MCEELHTRRFMASELVNIVEKQPTSSRMKNLASGIL